MSQRGEELVASFVDRLKQAQADRKQVQIVDDAFLLELETLRDEVQKELTSEFDEFVEQHAEKFHDAELNREKRFALVTPVKRCYAALLQRWRGELSRVAELHVIEELFHDITSKIDQILKEQGAEVDASNVE